MAYLGDGEELNNFNLFAYCGNNPVMYSDPTGHVPFFVVSALVLGVLGAAAGGWIAYKTDNNVWAGIGIGFAVGAAVGAVVGMAISYYLTGSISSSTTTVLNNMFHSTTLHRAVSSEELSSIKNSKKFESVPHSMDGKFFAKSKKGARKWGKYWELQNAQKSSYVRIRVPKKALKDPSVFPIEKLDTFDDAIYFSDLDYLNSVVQRIWVP